MRFTELTEKKWVGMLDRIARPVISNLAAGTLKRNMPFESRSESPGRLEASRLEAFGRTVCGLGPWLSLGPDDTRKAGCAQNI